MQQPTPLVHGITEAVAAAVSRVGAFLSLTSGSPRGSRRSPRRVRPNLWSAELEPRTVQTAYTDFVAGLPSSLAVYSFHHGSGGSTPEPEVTFDRNALALSSLTTREVPVRDWVDRIRVEGPPPGV